MSKQKKKRNKPYSGADAAITRPVVTRISAANRNPVSQWWFDHKTIMKPVSITSGVVVVIVWLIVELIRVVNGG